MLQNKKLILIGFLLVLLAGVLFGKYVLRKPSTPIQETVQEVIDKQKQSTPSKSDAANNEIPDKVYEVYQFVIKYGKAPEGYVGGRTFQNRENKLPNNNPSGSKINYQEWDVNPKRKGQNRGAERLVTGDDTSAYFTNDHYRNFIKIKPEK